MLTPSQIASADCAYWADLYNIKLGSYRFSFKNHEYQIEPMRGVEDKDGNVIIPRRKCIMKATQGGYTQIEVLDTLHALINKLLHNGVLYLFPTKDDVDEFAKSRFNPLILDNRELIGKYVKSGGKGTDTASLKKIHKAFLYLRGARLSQKIGDVNESSKLKSIPVDRVVFDEVDHMDDDVITKAIKRMGHSTLKQERYLSNPLIPGEGIDKIFQKSDQRHWFRKCGCGEWTCAELSFPDCVKIRNDGTGYIGCNKCGKEVPVWSGQGSAEWVPAIPANTDYMHGYHWSQLTSNFNDPAEILEDFTNPPQGNLADVYRLSLGLPYIAEEDRLTEPQVLSLCRPEIMPSSHKGPCAMGVDVGKIKHVVIGVKVNKNQYQIVKVCQLSQWDDILELAKRFNVKSCVIDIRPYEDSAREFQRKAKFKTWLCEYKETTPVEASYSDKTGIVAVNRTEIFDATHRLVTEPGSLVIPRLCPEIREFAKQMCGAYKVLETNKRTGTAVYRYKGSNDHYRNALNYFLLAARGGHIATVNKYINRTRKYVANNNYRRM